MNASLSPLTQLDRISIAIRLFAERPDRDLVPIDETDDVLVQIINVKLGRVHVIGVSSRKHGLDWNWPPAG